MNTKTYQSAIEKSLEILVNEYSIRVNQNLSVDDFPKQAHRGIINQLLCIRPPEENETLFQIMDSILAYEANKDSIVDPSFFNFNSFQNNKISLYRGDITKLKVNYITNAANSELLGCFQPTHKCIDNVIHTQAGPRLRFACINHKPEHKMIGNAFVTDGFSLPSTKVVHTVGPQVTPNIIPTKSEQDQLASCYKSIMEKVLEDEIEDPSIAFCCISTGLFGFDQKLATTIAIETIFEFLSNHQLTGWNIIFNVFTENDMKLYKRNLEMKFGKVLVNQDTYERQLAKSRTAIEESDYLLISGAAGLSASAGLDYTSEDIFKVHFPMMHKKGFKNFYQFIGFNDWKLYSNNPEGLKWAYYLSQVNLARYNWPKSKVYKDLLTLFQRFEPGNAFITTSNADGMFEQNGFPIESIYTIQGDYGRLQCLNRCTEHSYWDSKPIIDSLLPKLNLDTFEIPEMEVPKCTKCNGPLMLNVRGGNWFIETPFVTQKTRFENWKEKVIKDVQENGKKLVILEIGAGFNTPSVLRWPNEKLAQMDGVYLCRLNQRDYAIDGNGCGIPLDATSAVDLIVNGSLHE